MRTIDIKLYKIDELTEEARARAIHKYKMDIDYPFLKEDMTEHAHHLLLGDIKESADSHFQVYYSLSWSQGDGACVVGEYYFHEYLTKIGKTGHPLFLYCKEQNAKLVIKHRGNYYHEMSMVFETMLSDDTDENLAKLETLETEMIEFTRSQCKGLSYYGYRHIEFEDSNDAILENIRANDYEYWEDGHQY
jgi:hypothetical protein